MAIEAYKLQGPKKAGVSLGGGGGGGGGPLPLYCPSSINASLLHK